jgi:hypothetical protein
MVPKVTSNADPYVSWGYEIRGSPRKRVKLQTSAHSTQTFAVGVNLAKTLISPGESLGRSFARPEPAAELGAFDLGLYVVANSRFTSGNIR